jgi:AcrR family transcriptional regulator
VEASARADSGRRSELLEKAYQYVLEHGVADLSLRPLAAAIGSSPRVLLFLFGSKAELVQALLARARQDELELLRRVRETSEDGNIAVVASELWRWLAAPEHQGLLKLWVEGYARSLIDPGGPWEGFARRTVEDWLAVLGEAGAGGASGGEAGLSEAGASEAGTREAGTREAGASEAGDATDAEAADAEAEQTLVLAVLRGAFLDLLATGDVERTTAAVACHLARLRGAAY